MPVEMKPLRPLRDSRMDELDALIAAGKGDQRPVQNRRATVYRKNRAPWGSVKPVRLEKVAAEMKVKYAAARRGQASRSREQVLRSIAIALKARWPKRQGDEIATNMMAERGGQ